MALALIAGCSGSDNTLPNGGDASASPDGGAPPDLFKPDQAQPPPPHPMLPAADQHNGTILAAVNLVTITYNKQLDGNPWPYQSWVERLGDWIVTSDWFKAVGNEYGVGPGTHLMKVRLDTMPPMMITDQGLEQLMITLIKAGTLPPPKGDILYMIYMPPNVLVTNGIGASCTEFAGYHHAGFYGNARFTYAIVDDCTFGDPDELTNTASHELIEACTDPYEDDPGYFLDKSLPDPWGIEYGQELGDLCEDQPTVRDSGFGLTRSWSNAAATAGQDPCVPDQDPNYVNVRVDPATAPSIAAGASYTFTIYGWSASGKAPPWDIRVAATSSNSLIGGGGGSFTLTELKPQLHGTTIYDNASVTLTITVPSTANSGDSGGFVIQSGALHHSWPIAFTVQ
jgi:hypothetical protein